MNQHFSLKRTLAAAALLTVVSFAPAVAQVRTPATSQAGAPRITASAATNRAVDMYIKIDGVDGESRDNDHHDWIEVVSWSWGDANSAARQSRPVASGPGTLTIVRRVDKASPKLLEASTKGKSVGRIVVHVRANNGGYDEYVITNARVLGYQKTSANDRPTESLSLNFGKVESKKTGGNPDRPIVIGR